MWTTLQKNDSKAKKSDQTDKKGQWVVVQQRKEPVLKKLCFRDWMQEYNLGEQPSLPSDIREAKLPVDCGVFFKRLLLLRQRKLMDWPFAFQCRYNQFADSCFYHVRILQYRV